MARLAFAPGGPFGRIPIFEQLDRQVSLTPCFSWVQASPLNFNRFNGFGPWKPLKRFKTSGCLITPR
jgi:hypothetical protein